MKYEIRRLNPDTDRELFAAAYSWLEDSPRWRRESEEVFGVLGRGKYLSAARSPKRISIGIWTSDVFTAIISLTLVGHNAYEAHLEARRGSNIELLIAAAAEIRDQMWRYGAEVFCTYVPRWNRRVIAINKALGFQPTGVTMLRGSVRGHTVEWEHFMLTSPQLAA